MLTELTFGEAPAVELKTGAFRLVAPLSYGPRILHFGSADGPNLLIAFSNEAGAGPGGEFLFRGGHRFWHSPEHPVRTYQPDNDPVKLESLAEGSGFVLEQRLEAATGMRKRVRVELAGPRAVKVGHELTNEGLWAVTCAPWALTMFRGGGRAVIPLLPKGEHPRDLLSDYSLVPWPYTDFSSGAWEFFPGFIGLNTQKVPSAQKVGITGYPGWLAYWIDGEAFVKAAPYDPEAVYPDGGCKAEVFSDGGMIELETLGALGMLEPGASFHHHEYWGILPGLPEPVDEAAVRDHWLPAIDSWRKELVDV